MFFLKSKKNKQKSIKKVPAQNPRILEVNLIKGEVRISFDWKRHLAVSLLTIIIVAAFIFEIYFGLDLWAKQEMIKADKLAAQTAIVGKEVKEMQAKADAALLYKEKAIEVSRLLGEHVYWTNFFSWLEANTLSTVVFAGFSGDTNGHYNLEATASRYQEVSWQVKSLLDNPVVKKATVLQVSSAEEEVGASTAIIEEEISEETEEVLEVDLNRGQKSVSFFLDLEIDPNIFKK